MDWLLLLLPTPGALAVLRLGAVTLRAADSFLGHSQAPSLLPGCIYRSPRLAGSRPGLARLFNNPLQNPKDYFLKTLASRFLWRRPRPSRSPGLSSSASRRHR